MDKARRLHKRAMEFADRAFIAFQHGNNDLGELYSRKARQAEERAAELLERGLTRSVLYMSAAHCAYHAKQYSACMMLAIKARASNPPDQIAAEIDELVEKASAKKEG